MNTCKFARLILFAALFSYGMINAQPDFKPGFIVKNSGDTLYGQVDYRGDLMMGSLCRFKGDGDAVIEFLPNDISGYRFIDSKYFVSRELNGKNVFLECLIKGKVSVYYLRDQYGDHYYLDKEGAELIELPYEEKIEYINDKRMLRETKRHIGLLTYYMQDAPGLQPRIQGLRKPEHKGLTELAKDYHNTVCKDEQCIIYEKYVPLIKVLPEIIGGVIHYSRWTDVLSQSYVHGGFIAHIWMPRTSEKLYFRTGILYSQLSFSYGKYNYYKIPCQLEYIYPKGFFRPRVAYGLNFYKPNYQSVSFDLGGNIKLSETLFLSATTDVEFDPRWLIVPRDYISYSIKAGLFLNLK